MSLVQIFYSWVPIVFPLLPLCYHCVLTCLLLHCLTEKKCRTCAQFISAMKQVFQKYNIPMPHMPRAPRLTDIVIAPSNEGLPKAWELTTMWNSTSNNDAGETSSNEARYECILRADKTAHERFARECRVEKELRMKRKQTHVRLHKQIPPVRPARVTCTYVFGVNLFSFVLLFFCSFVLFWFLFQGTKSCRKMQTF